MLTAVFIGRRGWKRQCEQAVCHATEVCVADSAQGKFIDAGKVRSLMALHFEGVINVPVSRINLPKLEGMLNAERSISRAEAYFTGDNVLHVTVHQPTPLYKIETPRQLYYIIEDGTEVATANDWNGGIPRIKCKELPTSAEWIRQMGEMARWICKDGHFDTIEEISADADGELSVRRKGHDEVFELGTPEDFEIKFYKMDTYLRRIKPNRPVTDKGPREYKKVSVKYKGQIVCK